MREIKFRFYDDKVSKRMIYQDPIERMDRIFVKWEFTPKPSPLMQYTGLKDKNDKEIYEGDIIEFNNNDYARTAGHLDDEIIIAKVEYYCGHYGLKEVNGQLHDLYTAIVNDDEAEIIGNIYENPELIK